VTLFTGKKKKEESGDFLSNNVPEGPSADKIEVSSPVFKKEEGEMDGWIFRMLLVFGTWLPMQGTFGIGDTRKHFKIKLFSSPLDTEYMYFSF
jgi:hypothetical protein